MSRFTKLQNLPPLFLVLGLLGWWTRRGLYALGMDSKGLLTSHPLSWVLLVLTLLTAVSAVATTRRVQVLVPQGFYPAIGKVFLAIAMPLQVLTSELPEGLRLASVFQVLSWVGAVCGLLLALCQVKKKQPHFGLYAMLCVFFCVHQVLCYQLWSDQPQMQDYWFSLGAVLSVILFLYGQAAQELGFKHTQLQGSIGLFGIFCCCTALAHCEFPILYAGTALFFLTELTGLAKKEED